MIARRIAMILLMLSLRSIANAQSLVPLAPGGAPPCPEHEGSREFHSAVVRDGYVSAFIVGAAHRDASGCHKTVEVDIEQAPRVKRFAVPDADRQDFTIVDFSGDGAKLFLASEARENYPNEQFRNVQITTMAISSGEMRWHNVWDVLGWKDCDANVEPQGFVEGRLAFRAQPATMAPPRRANCVSEAHLFSPDQQTGMAIPIADATSIKRNGKVIAPASQACKSDPDMVGACFTVDGTLSAWNGAPTFRISRTATKRIFGITERPFPASVPVVRPSPLDENLNWDVEASGKFVVCPFTNEKPGHMQMVCIECATKVTFKPRH
jgi:hypothetical protein